MQGMLNTLRKDLFILTEATHMFNCLGDPTMRRPDQTLNKNVQISKMAKRLYAGIWRDEGVVKSHKEVDALACLTEAPMDYDGDGTVYVVTLYDTVLTPSEVMRVSIAHHTETNGLTIKVSLTHMERELSFRS